MIRKCKPEETTLVDELLTKLIQDERRWDSNVNPEFKVNNWYSRYINDDNRIIYVYEIEGKIVGYIHGYVEMNELFIKPEACLDSVYVEEDYRKNGIASELIDEFVKWCKEKNAGSIELGVYCRNTAANTLYAEKGFINTSLKLKKYL